MMRIYDGRSRFYQWDMNQQLTCDGLAVGDEVHFANAASTEALVVEAYALEDGTVVANVPNALLREPYPITAYRYIMAGAAEYTREATTFEVQKRPRPSDYIYTETEVYSFEVLSAEMRQALATLDEFNAKQDETLKALAEAKVDKVTSKDLDRVYVATHDGKQGTKPVTTAPSEWTIPQRESGGSVRVGRAKRDDAAVPLAQMTEALADKAGAKEVETLAKKVDNLEAGLAPDAFIVDESSAYVKVIPTDAAPYAEIRAVGGMTHKVEQLDPVPFNASFADNEWYAKYVTASPDGTVVFGNDTQSIAAKFNSFFPSVVVGKKYMLSVDASGGNLQPASVYAGYIPFDTPFVLTEEQYGSTIHLAAGIEDNGEAGQPVDSTFKFSLREVTDVLLDTPVTALDIVGKNLYNGGFGGNACATEENGVLTMTKAQNHSRWSKDWPAPVAMTEASISINIIATTLAHSIGAYCLYEDGEYGYIWFANSIGISTATFEKKDGARIKSITLYIQPDDAVGVSIKLKDIMILPTADPTDTTYSPYHKTTFAIPAAVQALDGYGWGISSTLHNGIEWDEDGKPVYVKRVGRVVYDGTENWVFSDTDNTEKWRKYVDVQNKPYYLGAGYMPSVVCNYYEPHSAGGNWMRVTSVSVSGDGVFVYDEKYSTKDVSLWKEHLAELHQSGDPLVVYYELAEPIVTDVSAYFTEDSLVAVEGGGTITAVNAEGLAAPTTIVYQATGQSLADAFDEVHEYAMQKIGGNS